MVRADAPSPLIVSLFPTRISLSGRQDRDNPFLFPGRPAAGPLFPYLMAVVEEVSPFHPPPRCGLSIYTFFLFQKALAFFPFMTLPRVALAIYRLNARTKRSDVEERLPDPRLVNIPRSRLDCFAPLLFRPPPQSRRHRLWSFPFLAATFGSRGFSFKCL